MLHMFNKQSATTLSAMENTTEMH